MADPERPSVDVTWVQYMEGLWANVALPDWRGVPVEVDLQHPELWRLLTGGIVLMHQLGVELLGREGYEEWLQAKVDAGNAASSLLEARAVVDAAEVEPSPSAPSGG